MDENDKKIYESSGATNELGLLAEWLVTNPVNRETLRTYVLDRVQVNEKTLNELKLENEAEKKRLGITE